MHGERYRRIVAGPDGSVPSETLGLRFRVEGSSLRAVDSTTDAPILRPEDERQRADAEAQRADAEAARTARYAQRLRELGVDADSE